MRTASASGWRRRAPRLSLRLAAAIGLGVFAGDPAESVEPEDTAREAEPRTAPEVGLDALLRLPTDTGGPPDPDGAPAAGAERERWMARFAAVRGELTEARASLAQAQGQLEEMARKTENWQIAAPGAQATPENSPISYKLRQDIRGYREEVERAERRLRDLEVEASLAGVPAEWRRPPEEDASP